MTKLRAERDLMVKENEQLRETQEQLVRQLRLCRRHWREAFKLLAGYEPERAITAANMVEMLRAIRRSR